LWSLTTSETRGSCKFSVLSGQDWSYSEKFRVETIESWSEMSDFPIWGGCQRGLCLIVNDHSPLVLKHPDLRSSDSRLLDQYKWLQVWSSRAGHSHRSRWCFFHIRLQSAISLSANNVIPHWRTKSCLHLLWQTKHFSANISIVFNYMQVYIETGEQMVMGAGCRLPALPALLINEHMPYLFRTWGRSAILAGRRKHMNFNHEWTQSSHCVPTLCRRTHVYIDWHVPTCGDLRLPTSTPCRSRPFGAVDWCSATFGYVG
jgi:hypothetical protein